MMKRIICSLVFVVALAGSAPAQSPLERAKAALPAEAARGLDQAIAHARARGLPTSPLVDKALEGVAKRAPAAAILEAVRRRLELLGRADATLRPFGPPAPTDVTAVADVLQRGLSEDLVTRARGGARTGEPIDLALHTLADLLERDVPVDVAFEMLSSWRAHGANADDLRQMPAAVERLVREGATPASAGRSVAASVRTGKPATVPGKSKAPAVSKPGKRVGPPVPPGSNPGRKDKTS